MDYSLNLRRLFFLSFITMNLSFVSASGRFELQVLKVENTDNTLKSGECCAGYYKDPESDSPCPVECSTAFALCLKEWSVAADKPPVYPGGNASPPGACTYGYNSTGSLGPSSFTLVQPPSDGHMSLEFTFSWTRSFTLILEVFDLSSNKKSLSRPLIDSSTYSGILVPGIQWHTLTHTGPSATITYRVRVVCDENYYNTTCNKLCRPRDDRLGHYFCNEEGDKVCVPGWTGDNCEKAICKEGCHPVHGECMAKPGECMCRSGWQGELCDQCLVHPGCVNGYCNATPWTCECHLNWGGLLCDQDLNYCGRDPCLNGGTCINIAPDKYNCTCPRGFSGKSCEVVDDPCAVTPCANGGVCSEVEGGFQCTCDEGWHGHTCEMDVDDCASGPCLHNGTCTDKLNGFTCECAKGWEGPNCQFDSDECQGQPCVNALSCTNLDGDYSCECMPGWGSKDCTQDMRDCYDQCLNGATCIDLVADYHCACQKGYTGDHCEIDINECESDPCQNGGECVDLVADYQCICLVGYSGKNCQMDIDLCNPNPCANGAPCINTPSDYFCYCNEFTHGKNCSLDKNKCTAPPCDEGRICHLTSDSESSGSLDSCGQYGTCVSDDGDSTRCDCDEGYTGQYCHIEVDSCSSNPCRNGATCVDLDGDGYKCVCDYGWEGPTCEHDTDECADNPCRHNSTCVDLIGEYKCQCINKWRGRHCTSTRSACDASTCKNGGTCIEKGQDFECVCSTGWRGLTCQMRSWQACDSSPCLNGGTCINTGDDYNCICKQGFNSLRCEKNINDCASNPCVNGGTCVDGVNWHKCECAKGYYGPNCKSKIDSCQSSPCAFGSTCIDAAKGEYKCICPPGRAGHKCDTVVMVNEANDQALLDNFYMGNDINSCMWEGSLRPHGSVWRHQCNTCHCNHGIHSCTNIWCGPQNCRNKNNPSEFCLLQMRSSVCVSGPSEWCLHGPCEPWGDCRHYDIDGNIGPLRNPGYAHCRPNHAVLSNSCSRLTLVMEKTRIPVGSHVQTICEGLRSAWAASFDVSQSTLSPVILCSLAPGYNLTSHTMEITLSYPRDISDGSKIIRAARILGELISHRLTLIPALTSVTEVKVETLVTNSDDSEAVSTILISVTVVLLLLLMISGASYYLYVRRRSKTCLSYASRNQLNDDTSDNTNQKNDEKLWKYNNSPIMLTTSLHNNSSDPDKLASLGLSTAPPISRHTNDYNIAVPQAIRKIQNTDVERNITPFEPLSKDVHKDMNISGLPNNNNQIYRDNHLDNQTIYRDNQSSYRDKFYPTHEVIV